MSKYLFNDTVGGHTGQMWSANKYWALNHVSKQKFSKVERVFVTLMGRGKTLPWSSVFKTYFPMCRMCITCNQNQGLILLTLEQIHDSPSSEVEKCSVKVIIVSVFSSYIPERLLKETEIVLS